MEDFLHTNAQLCGPQSYKPNHVCTLPSRHIGELVYFPLYLCRIVIVGVFIPLHLMYQGFVTHGRCERAVRQCNTKHFPYPYHTHTHTHAHTHTRGQNSSLQFLTWMRNPNIHEHATESMLGQNWKSQCTKALLC